MIASPYRLSLAPRQPVRRSLDDMTAPRTVPLFQILLVAFCATFGIALTSLQAGGPVSFSESPAGSGIFTTLIESEFTALNANDDWVFEAEAGDRLSVRAEAAIGNSRPRVRVLNASDTVIGSIDGGTDGIAAFDDFRFTTPGTYRIRFFTQHQVGTFSARVTLTRGVDLETEANDTLPTADVLTTTAGAQSLAFKVVGLIPTADVAGDTYTLGLTPGGAGLTTTVQLNDSSLSAADLSLQLFEQRIADRSLDFSSHFATVPHSPVFDAIETANVFSISGWVFIDGASWFSLFDKYEATNDFGWVVTIENNSNGLQLYSGTGGTAVRVTSGVTVPTGQWNHVAVTYDHAANQVKFFLNGALTATRTSPGALRDTDGEPAYIGYGPSGGDDFTDGRLAELTLWNRVLSEAEIATQARAYPLVGNESGLVGLWRFDEGSGTTTVDASPSGLTATLGGGDPVRVPGWGIGAIRPAVAPVTGVNLSHTFGATASTWLRVLGTSNRGLSARYILGGTLTDTSSFQVIASTLPAPGLSTDGIVEGFTVGFNEELDPVSANTLSHYSLRSVPLGGTFGVSPESVYPVTVAAYTTGTTLAFTLVDGPLQPGLYRFSISLGLTDKFGNPLASTYTREFSVTQLGGFILENRNNESYATATTLAPAGVGTAFDGSWSLQTPLAPGGNQPMGLATADFNQDGNLDVVSANYGGGNIGVLLGNGNGTFQPAVTYAAPNNPFKVVTADFNHDNRPDIAVTRIGGDAVRVFLNSGTGTFAAGVDYATGNGPHGLAVADLNGDTHPDLVVANYNGSTFTIRYGNADGTFQAAQNTSVPGNPLGVAIGDLNGDGRLDFGFAGHGDSAIRVYHRQADGSYAAGPVYAWTSNPQAVAIGDLNGDGRDDLISAQYTSSTELRRWHQQADGSLLEAAPIPFGWDTNTWSIRFHDLDGDGDQDLVVGRYYYVVTITNQGGGSFGNVTYPHTYHHSRDALAGDFNEDGRIDLLASAQDNHVLRIFFGLGIQQLAADGGDGSRVGYARGNNYSASDIDFFSFTATAGDRVFVGSEHPGHPSSSGLHYRIYRADEADDDPVASFYGDYGSSNGTGQTQFVAPITGTYFIRVSQWHGYRGEYRIGVATIPGTAALESEDNNSTGAADPLPFAQNVGTQTAAVLGYLRVSDPNDTYTLGNLAGGTQIILNATKPPSSGLVWILEVFRSGVTNAVAVEAPGAPTLTYTLPADASGFYYARIRPSAGADLNGQYRLAVTIADTAAPTVTSNDLPAEGSTVTTPVDRFTLGFSEDMLATTVNSVASYELVNTTNGDLYTVALTAAYTTGLSQSFVVTDGPLQPGAYRFRALPALQDRYLNPLVLHQRTFSVTGVAPFLFESRSNDTRETATTLSPTGVSPQRDGSWNFQTPLAPGGNQPMGLATADFNQDGNLDVVSANYGGGNIGVLLGNGNGTFQPAVTYAAPNNPFKVVTADFNHDNRPDIAVTRIGGDAVRVFLNLAASPGTFAAGVDYATGNGAYGVATADLNGDTHPDLVVANYNGSTVTIRYGNADGTFQAAQNTSIPGNPYGVALGDLNNDGRIDIALACYDSSVRILYREVTGTYAAPLVLPWTGGNNTNSVAIGDMNGDGRNDVAAVQDSGTEIRRWHQQLDGTLAEAPAIPFGWSTNSWSIRFTDLDGDGDQDLVVGRYYHVVTVTNLGGGNFGNVTYPHTYHHTRDALAADFNEDGRIDLLACAQDNHVLRLFLGRGTEQLTADGADGTRIGYGRGNNYSASDVDFFSFSAQAGDRVFVGSEHPGHPGSTGLYYAVYRPDEADDDPVASFYGDYGSNNGTGQTQFVAPVSGTYYIRVSQWHGYRGEYRIGVAVIPGTAALESETNNAYNSGPDALPFAQLVGAQTASVLGYLRVSDPADVFALGNLAEGTQITLNATKPPSSGLIWILDILNSAGAAVASEAAGVANLSYTLPVGSSGAYYARIRPSSGNDLNGQYRLAFTLADTAAPFITSNTLPTEGSTVTTPLDRFTLGFSEDMLTPTVNSLASYELVNLTTGDTYTLALNGAYASGLVVNFLITDGPLQAGNYRFRALSSLQDRYLNPLSPVHQRTFTVADVPPFLFESRSNDTRETATTLSPTGVSPQRDGSWNFQTPIAPGGNQPMGLATADFNQDGNLDVVSANYGGGNIGVLLGNGNGTFQPAVTYAAPNNPFKVVTADFNHDNRPDIAVTRIGGDAVRVFLNSGTGTFAAGVDYATGNGSHGVATADLNGDTHPDLVVTNYNASTVTVRYGNGDGTFQAAQNTSVPGNPYGIAIGDLNNDGRLDLAAGCYGDGAVRVLYRQVDGTYTLGATLPWPGQNTNSVAIGDMNGDGRNDVAAVQDSGTEIRRWHQQLDGTLAEAPAIPFGWSTNSWSIRFTDLDGDGDQDLVVGRYYHVVTVTNLGGGNFGQVTYPHTYHHSRDALAADFNEDGRIDLLACAQDNHVLRLFLGRGTEQLTADGADGTRIGYGRGNNYSASDVDFFSFSAQAGDRVFVGSEHPGHPGSTGLYYAVYRPDEADDDPVASFYGDYGSNNGTGQTQFVAPVSGTYYIRVSQWHGYRGEYRIGVAVIPGTAALESETNNAHTNADPLPFNQVVGGQTASVLGYLRVSDPADVFALGNLAEGVQITLDANKPPSSGLVWFLDILNSAGNQIATSAAGASSLSYTLPAGASGAYYARIRPSSGADLNAQYRLTLTLADLIAPSITGDTLPVEASTVTTILDRFSLSFSEDMLASAVNSLASYDLRAAGGDTAFGTGDDVIVPLVIDTAYSSGLSVALRSSSGLLQPGRYRFTAYPTLVDKAQNPLVAPYVRTFTVAQIPGYVFEQEPNSTVATATLLAPGGTQPGFLTAGARGYLLNSSDTDYYTFAAEAGDEIIIYGESLQVGSSGLAYQLTNPSGVEIFQQNVESAGAYSTGNLTLTATGVYRFRVTQYHGYYGEYRFRILIARGDLQLEIEPNGGISTATPVVLATAGNNRTGEIAGLSRTSGELDYFALGTLQAGTSVFLSTRIPAGSTFVPVVSLYNASGVLMTEATGGRPGDGVAQVPISTTGSYYAVARTSGQTGGLLSDYVLDFLVVPTADVSFPNLQATITTPLPANGLTSGGTSGFAFRVNNLGNLPTPGVTWIDRVVLSTDAVYSPNDLEIGAFPRTGPLASAGFYTVNGTVNIPDGIGGAYYVIVRTDATNTVNEFVLEGDNETVTDTPINITLSAYPDLVVEGLALSEPDGSGVRTASWTLANRGTGGTTGGFTERVLVRNANSGTTVLNDLRTVPGSFAPNATVARNAQITVTTPGTWTVDITVDASAQRYEFNASGHTAAEINNTATTGFQIIRNYTITVAADPTAGGSVSGAGTFPETTSRTVTATPNSPYLFLGWFEDGFLRSNNASYTFSLLGDRNLTGRFALPSFFIATPVSPAGTGTVTGGGTHPLGSGISLTATPQPGYNFVNWTEGASVLGTGPTIAISVTAARTIQANFTEANPSHTITTATLPAGLATVTGAGVIGNGIARQFTAPATIVVGDTEHVFTRYTLNGAQVATTSTWTRTFSTLDPAAIAIVAEYTARSLKPVVDQVTTNFGNPIPATTNFRLTLRFDRAMDPNFKPTVQLQSGNASAIPAVPTTGTWANATTFEVPAITFGANNGGLYNVRVSAARDTQGRIMDLATVYTFTADVVPPALPTLTQGTATDTTIVVNWTGYSAPADLASFRVYRSPTTFASVAALSPIASLSAATRTYTFGGLAPDTDFFVAIVPADSAGNALTTVPAFLIRANSTIPPAIVFNVAASATNAARLTWTFSTTGQIGFEGFRIYRSNAAFTSTAGLTPIATVGSGIRSFDDTGLNRLQTYHYAVVGYNRLGQALPAVVSKPWSDPLSGTITTDFTISEPAVEILQPITIAGGATFTVPAGTTVRFAPGAGLTVSAGRLNVNGTLFAPVIFTSLADVDGGSPVVGAWAGITLADATRASTLRHLFLRYGSGLAITGAPAGGHTLETFAAVWNSGAGLRLANATQTVTGAYLVNNDVGARTEGTAALTLTGSVLNNQTFNATRVAGTFSATGNWWGTADTAAIAAKVSGTVTTTSPLTSEPVLTRGLRTASLQSSTSVTPLPLQLASLNATAYRLSEDSTFAGGLFLDVPRDPLSPDLFNDAPFDVSFPLSAGAGAKTIYVQFRSSTGAVSPTQSIVVTYVTQAPTIGSFSLTEGQTITRPLAVSATATSPLGLGSLKFFVDDVEVATSATSPLSFRWDIRTLSAGTHRVRLEARDVSGGLATRSLNVLVNPATPPQPVLTSPANNLLTTGATVAVTGTAESLADIRLTRNGAVIATVQANAAGAFAVPSFALIEGVNEIIATAFDVLGTTGSTPIVVNRDSGAPAAVTLLPLEYQPDDGIFLDWDLPAAGEVPVSYRVFWHSAPFTSAAQATGQSELTLRSSTILGTAVPDGLRYFAVVGYDAAGNASPLSNVRSLQVDQTKPAFTVAFNRTSPIGPGDLGITITASEPLSTTPLLFMRGEGGSLLTITLTAAGGNSYTATFPVTTLSARSGPANLGVTAKDLAENTFTGAPTGPALVFDLTRPTGVIATSVPSPVQTVPSDVTLSVSLTLSELPAANTSPTLTFAAPGGGGSTAVPLSGSGLAWSGQLTVTSAMGNGDGTFLLNVTDTVGNAGTVLTSGEKLEIYNTATPSSPAIPGNLVLEPLSGGRMQLTWNAAAKALSYRVYREAGASAAAPTVLVASDITGLTFTDLPPVDGTYRYAVTAFRLGAESPPSGVRAGPSDRTPPPAPTATTATLGASGINVAWTPAASGDVPARFVVYRNGTVIRTVSNATTSLVDSPPRGVMNYRVAAADPLGNEALGPTATIELFVGAVTNLRATVDAAAGTELTWTSTDGTATGFNVFRNGVKQNATPLGAPSFTDTLASAGVPTLYAITAVNASAQQSAPRTLLVQPVTATLEVNPTLEGVQRSVANYFDNYRLTYTVGATASAAVAFTDGEVIRVVEGEDPLSELFDLPASVAVGSTQTTEIAIPAPLIAATPQAAAITLRTTPDAGGSTVHYRFIADVQAADPSGLMISVSAAEPPLAGGVTDFNVRVFNRGYLPADLVLTRGNNSQPGDLAMQVITSGGVLASTTPFQAALPGVILNGDGEAFLRVPAGGFVDIPFPDVFVPEALSNETSVTFRARFAAIYHAAGSTYERVAGPLEGTMVSSLRATPYYGTAQTSQPFYADNQPVVITGQALARDTGAPVPNAPLRIGVRVQGAVLYYPILTDATGGYTFNYTPTFGLAGELVIWAAHPEIVDQLEQARVRFYRMLTKPGRAEIVMSKNDTLDFDIGLLNLGDVALSDTAVTFRAWRMDGANEVPITTLTGTARAALPSAVAPKGEVKLLLRLQAALDAPDNAMVEFTFTTAEGASAKFTGTVALRPALAVLTTVSPTTGYAEAGLVRGDLRSVDVTVQNRGLRALTGVKLTPPANVPWMSINLEVGSDGKIDLPDIPVGGSRSFTVVFAPPENTGVGFYNDFLKITGQNAVADYQFNLFATVTSEEKGAVFFTIKNSLGDPVPNTSIWLRNSILGTEVGPLTTDAVGEVTASGLVEGDWQWKTAAPGHTATQGVVAVVPDQTVGVFSELLLSLVTVKFSVVPVAFTDYYEIKIEQTFQTRTPIPNLVLSPPHTNLSVEPGWTGTLIYKLKNEGLRSAFEVDIQKMSLPTMRLTPLVTYIPELFAQEEVEIPVYFEYFGPEAAAAAEGSAPASAQLAGLFSAGGSSEGFSQASAPPAFGAAAGFSPSGVTDTLEDIYKCYKEMKYGTITLRAAAFIDCASGDTYNVGVNATINVDELLALVCDGECPDNWTSGAGALSGVASKLCSKVVEKIVDKVSKKTKVIDIICKASNIIKAIVCAAAHLPEGRISGGGPGGGGPGGGGFGPGGGGGGGWSWGTSVCFAAGTPITLADGTTKAVEALTSGDTLLSSLSGQVSPLGQIRSLTSDHVRELSFQARDGFGAARTLQLTHDHRVWIDGKGWVFSSAVAVGDWLHGSDGRLYEVTANTRLPGSHAVYALHLDGDRVLYAAGVLVEDQCFQEVPAVEVGAQQKGGQP